MPRRKDRENSEKAPSEGRKQVGFHTLVIPDGLCEATCTVLESSDEWKKLILSGWRVVSASTIGFATGGTDLAGKKKIRVETYVTFVRLIERSVVLTMLGASISVPPIDQN